MNYFSIAIVTVLLFSNVWLLLKYKKYKAKGKQRGLLFKWPIPQVLLEQIDPIFKSNEHGPTLNTLVQLIGRGDDLHGGTSDTEAWVLAVLSKSAKNIFEFGTCTGKTTYLLAKNSSEKATVTTLTLSPDQINEYVAGKGDDTKSTNDALIESIFTQFLYTGTREEKKIVQLFCDSKHFDEKPYAQKMDMIFIDGSHAYSYVINDSEKAFRMIAPGGIILWHDYRGTVDTKDVFKALNQIAKTKRLMHIKDTSLVAYRA